MGSSSPLIRLFADSTVVATDTVVVPAVTVDTDAGGEGTSTATIEYDASSTSGVLVVLAYLVQGGSTGTLRNVTSTPADASDDASIGTEVWTQAADITGTTARSGIDLGGSGITDSSVVLIKADGSLSATNMALGQALTANSADSYTWGGEASLWGETLTPADVNDPDFGIAMSFTSSDSGKVSHYLKANNFFFAIPSTSTILGIKVVVHADEEDNLYGSSLLGGGFATLRDPFEVTIYYSDPYVTPVTFLQWEGTAIGNASTTSSAVTVGSYIETSMTPSAGVLTFSAKCVYGILGQGKVTNGPWTVRYYILQLNAAN